MGSLVTICICFILSSVFNTWGSWCVFSCSASVLFILVSANYFNYYLLSEWLGLDQMALVLVVLCFVVLVISVVSSCKDLRFNKGVLEKSSSDMVGLITLTLLAGMFCFSLASFMDFFFFFEFSLIPTFWLILKWGYQPERLQAGFYMMLYTVSASLPLLISLVSFWLLFGSDNMLLTKCLGSSILKECSDLVWLVVVLGFLVKLPVYFFHGWLPKAHVEAPLSGSIILAGVLLKFGVYGVVRFMWLSESCLTPVILGVLCFSIWGGAVSSCVCVVQTDLKSLIAYSSIGHMAMSLGGVLCLYSLGKCASVCLLFAHGLLSPVLFSLAASSYDVVGTRNVVLSKGVLRVFPLFSFIWFLGCILNMGFPPSLNFFGEVYSLTSIIWLNWGFMVPMGLMVFMAGCYSLVLYGWVNHGIFSNITLPRSNLSCRYVYSAVFCLVVLLAGFVCLDFFMIQV